MRRMSGRLRSMLSSASLGVGSSGAHGAGDIARARRARITSRHLLVAATNKAASDGGAGLAEICAEISSKARKEEKRLLFVHSEEDSDLGGSTASLAAVAGEGASSACGLGTFDVWGGFFGCLLFLLRADRAGFVSSSSSGGAAARVASTSNSA